MEMGHQVVVVVIVVVVVMLVEVAARKKIRGKRTRYENKTI